MPDWEHRLWSEPDYLHLLSDEVRPLYDSTPYEGGRKYAQQADIAGKFILYELGGVMMCADFVCLRDMSPLFEGKSSAVLWWETNGQMSNGLIGAPPGNPAVGYTTERMGRALRQQRDRSNSITYGAGPVFLQSVWRGRNDLEIRPAREIYPYFWNEPDPGEYGDAYAVHRWKASWKE
jgi:mannosyltransferase OCH1-like enzyme